MDIASDGARRRRLLPRGLRRPFEAYAAAWDSDKRVRRQPAMFEARTDVATKKPEMDAGCTLDADGKRDFNPTLAVV